MSLILSCISPEYLIIVADQRLRAWGTGKLEEADGANKIVTLVGTAIFSYAGVGRLGGQLMDRWIAERLSARGDSIRNIPFDAAVNELRVGATELFREKGFKTTDQIRWLRHTFIGVGYMLGGSPHLAVISNAASSATLSLGHQQGVDYSLKWDDSPQNEFKSSMLDLAKVRRPIVFFIGSSCTGAEDLLKQASRAARKKRSQAEVESILKEAIKAVSRHDENVSRTSTTVMCQSFITSSGIGIGTGRLSAGTLAVMGKVIWRVGEEIQNNG